MSSLIVEGGAETATAFLEAGLVDRIVLFHGSRAIGWPGIAAPVDRRPYPGGLSVECGKAASAIDSYAEWDERQL